MWKSSEPRFDVASAICQGGRDYQEDALVTDFPSGTDIGIAVLADGMGGHAAGDVASKIVVTQVYGDLKFDSDAFTSHERSIPKLLSGAAANANSCIREYVSENRQAYGMGATLVALVLIENRMYWMSIGDSPLYLFRNGRLTQLNEDHSMAPQIDLMCKTGMIDAETAKNHPDRNCLTSVIYGQNVAKADCPKTPFELQVGDTIVMSSDGLQFLEEQAIERLLHKYRRRKSAEIAERLLGALQDLGDPDQDNISFSVIKLNHDRPLINATRQKPRDLIGDTSASATRVISLDTAKAAKQPAPPAEPVEEMPRRSAGL